MGSNDTQGQESVRDQLEAAAAEPLTPKDRIVGLLMAIVIAGLGVWMFLRPVLIDLGGNEPNSRKARGFMNMLDWIWSRPVGVIAILLALLMIYGSLTKKSAPKGD